jgi:hypothetical protein
VSAISPNVTSEPYHADGSQRVFQFNFSIADKAEISVLIDGAVVSDALYTVAFGDLSGTVTFNAPPANGGVILLLSSPDFGQASSFESQGAYTLDTVNKINRRAAIRDLVLKDKADRALKLPMGSATPELPPLAAGEGKVIGIINGELRYVENDGVAIEGAVETATAAASAAAANALQTGLDVIAANAAANASLVASGLWIDEPTGRAAVANGAVFVAVGTTTDKAVDVWQRVGAGVVSTLLRSYPSITALNAAIANFNAAVAAAASIPTLLNAKTMGYQRTAAAADLGNGYGAPSTTTNGKITFPGGGSIQGFLYYLSGPDLAQVAAGAAITARVPIVTGTPASSRLIQYNAAGAEVGVRPTAVITATEIGFHAVTLNAAAVKLQLEITSSGASLVTNFMAVSLGEPATVLTDALFNERLGYMLEQQNEVPIVPISYTLFQQGTDATFVGGLLTQSANAGASSGLGIANVAWVVGAKLRLRFRSNSRLLQAGISTAYTGDANAFAHNELVAKVSEVPGDAVHVFFDFEFTIPPHPTFPAYPLRGITLGLYSPTQAVVCDDFVGAADFRLPPVRTPPLAVRTYIAQAIATALAAGGTTLQVPTAAVDLWGDSLIDFGHTAGAVSDALSTLLGGAVPVQNLGVTTQNAAQIAARAGGTPTLLSLVGDAIPATTTPVAISNFNAINTPITSASNSTNLTDPLAGTLGGVAGHLDSVRSSGVVTGLTFTRNVAGSAVPITKNTPFLPTQGEATRSKYQVMIWGKNDVGGTGGTASGNLIADIYDRQVRAMLPVDKRYLVGTVLHSNRDPAADVINDMNAAIALRHGRYLVDLTSAPTTEEMSTLGFTPTADDLTDMDAVVVATVAGTALTINSVTSGTVTQWKYLDPQAFRGNYTIMSGSGAAWALNGAPGNFTSQTITLKGFIPRGMRSGAYSGGAGVLGGDQLHLNTIGNQLWALRLFRAFKQRGWF